jgi:hypothetical protein
MDSGERDNPAAARPGMPTMLGFVWAPKTITPAMRALPGDLWCVRDAFCALMGWQPGSGEWRCFIEAQNGPADMERLIDHLGLVSLDPEYPGHASLLQQALDHPGIASYKLHRVQLEHLQYQPHLRHFVPLPSQYLLADPDPELFQIIVDLRQGPHLDCPSCQTAV